MATKKTVKKVETKKTTPKKEVKHVTPELIYDVLHGKYGSEGERNRKLLAEGYSPSAVTKKINDLKKLAVEFKPFVDKAGDYYGCLFCIIKGDK